MAFEWRLLNAEIAFGWRIPAASGAVAAAAQRFAMIVPSETAACAAIVPTVIKASNQPSIQATKQTSKASEL